MAGLNPLYPAPDKWRPGDNLLDNACFLNVVNQRGEKEYMGVVYGIDRWIGLDTRTIVSVEDGYVKVSASDGADSLWAIRQAVKPEARNFLKNRLATVSVLSTKGLVSLTSDKFFVSDISKQSQNEDGLAVWVNADSVLIAFMSGGKSELIAAMLEPGPEQHLAHKEGGRWVVNRVPDYRTELMKCQAYQNGSTHEFSAENIYNYGFALQAIFSNAICGSIKFPVTMRKIPLVTIKRVRQIRTGTILTISSCYYSCTEDGITMVNNMAFDGGATLDAGEWYQVEYWADANP